jgi:hypothetical protein
MKQCKDVKLSTKNGITYFVKIINKDLYDIIKKSINAWKANNNCDIYLDLHPNSLLAYGKSDDVDEEFLKEYIDYCKVPVLDSDKFTISSKCYAIEKHDCKTSRLHHSCIESWKCILSILNNPKYVLIYKKDAI